MTDNPITVDAADPIERVEGLLRELDVRHLPVLDDGDLLGIISDRDLGPYRGDPDEEREPVTAAQIMSGDLITVTPETDVGEAVDTMLDQRVGALPVVDSDTRSLVGIVSYVDVLKALRSEL